MGEVYAAGEVGDKVLTAIVAFVAAVVACQRACNPNLASSESLCEHVSLPRLEGQGPDEISATP